MGYDVVIGLDVGKSMHHAVALDPEGRRLVDREVANAEPALRELFGRAAGEGQVPTDDPGRGVVEAHGRREAATG